MQVPLSQTGLVGSSFLQSSSFWQPGADSQFPLLQVKPLEQSESVAQGTHVPLSHLDLAVSVQSPLVLHSAGSHLLFKQRGFAGSLHIWAWLDRCTRHPSDTRAAPHTGC